MKAAGCADGKLLSRRRVLKALEAVSRPYRIVVSGRTLASSRADAAIMAGLGVSTFAGYVKPDGLTRISGPLRKLGTLEFVLDTPKANLGLSRCSKPPWPSQHASF
jgi:hypothetical protein